MTREEFLDEVAALYERWAPTTTVTVDPEYSNNKPSQYPETITAMSASPEDEDRYWAEFKKIRDQYYKDNNIPLPRTS